MEENHEVEICSSLLVVQRPSYLTHRIGVTVRAAEIPDISISDSNGKQINELKEVVVHDRQKNFMTLKGVVGDDTVAFIGDMFRHTREFELIAEVIQDGDHYALKMIAAHPIKSNLQLIGAQDPEIEKCKTVLAASMKSEGGTAAYIQSKIAEIMNLQHLDQLSALRKALLAVILQTLSCGRVSLTPARINILLVGAPGAGKGRIIKAATILSPVSELISSNAVTPAGLVGVSTWSANRRASVSPGKLALADRGVAVLEDMQHVDSYSRGHVFGIFCEAMENGRLVRTTYRDVDIECETALLCDLNPKSSVRPAFIGKEILLLDDLDLPVSLLSRFDLVILFDRNVVKQMETMKLIISSTSTIGPAENVDLDPRARELRVLTALLRDLHPTINVESVTPLVNKKLEELLEANREKLDALHMAADFLLRAAKSLLKLVAAASRLHGRSEATEDDVGMAFDVFEEKMKFLSAIEPTFEHVKDWKNTSQAKEQRRMRIMETHAGRTVRLTEVAALFPELSHKTVLRDLHELGAKFQGDGKWAIPQVPAA